MKIAVLGLWHLGEVYAACLAELGHRVVGIDQDAQTIDRLNRGIPPLAEPRLHALLRAHLTRKTLAFSTSLKAAASADVLWVTFDTPVDARGQGDVRSIIAAMRRAVPHLRRNALVIVSSQLPVGTSARLHKLMGSRGYAYVPENLRVGDGVRCFMHPERVVVGASSPAVGTRVERLLRRLPASFVHTDPASAEMAKHALNAFLSTSLSFIYDIADLCEREGADVLAVSRALKSDPRIGERAYLDASLGFSGWSLGRDLKTLQSEGRRLGVSVPVIRAVDQKNHERRRYIFSVLRPLGSLYGKRVAFLGLAYKAGTTTLRRSLALELARMVAAKGAAVTLHDPSVTGEDIRRACGRMKWTHGRTLAGALKGAHAAVLITPWPTLQSVSWRVPAKGMRRPRLFIDARNALAGRVDAMRKAGIRYHGVGRSSLL